MSSDRNIVREIFYFASLILVFEILMYAFWGHQGNILIDCGREAYIPEQVLEGKILYKDIFILYGPLSYQINAFLYEIFRIHLNTLYWAGVVNSLFILSVYYWIARKLTSIKVSWIACFLLITFCIFSFGLTGYIFPYSYAVIYALSAFLVSVLLCIFYIENARPVFLILAGMFMGISAVCKIDFILFSTVLFLIAIYFKPLYRKNFILFILSFFIIPAVSWGILFLKELEINEVLSHLGLMNDFMNSHLFKYFYQENTGLYPTPKVLWALGEITRDFFYNFIVSVLAFYAFFTVFAKLPGFIGKRFLQVISFIALYWVFPKEFIWEMGTTISIGWIAVGTTVILAVFLIVLYIKNNRNNKKFTDIELKDKFFILVALAGIFSAFKSFFFINLSVFGTYFVPLLILVNVVFLFDKLPDYLRLPHKKAWRNACFTVLFLVGLSYMLTGLNSSHREVNYPIKTDRGKIFTVEKWGKALDRLISYVEKEVSDESSFVMMPEGLIVNFLTDKDGNNRFYSLTPNFVEAFEERIIRDLKIKEHEFIFITNQKTLDYGFSDFGKDYGTGIYNFVRNNYEFLRTIKPEHFKDGDLKIDVYKIKPSSSS